MVCFTKGTKNDLKYPKPNSRNKIKDDTSITETENADTFIHNDLSDLELGLDDSDLWPKESFMEITQIHIKNNRL